MYLTREEERVLAGEEGEARRLALSVIVKVGEALGAERLIPIKHAHVSGASYSTVGDAGRRFIEDLARMGARFSVPTTVNPVGIDTEDLDRVPASYTREYLRGQKAILDSFRIMGADLILTCTPYYTHIPRHMGLEPGSHVAWGESSAVVYGNSFLGLRTNREGGPLALMAGIAGRTYYQGLHTPEGRSPVVEIRVEQEAPLDEAVAGVLGEAIVEYTPHGRVPLVKARIASEPGLRELAAAVGTAGDLGMIHLEGVTPEKPSLTGIEERVTIDRVELGERIERVSPGERPDIVYIGCPHAGINDLELLERELRRLGRPRSRILVSTSRHVYMEALRMGLVGRLEGYGVQFVRDTCLIVSPFRDRSVSVATNSYKAYFYLSRKGVKASLAPIPRLVEASR
ncbi:MAG: aconitase X catalytic domain-containing protein [Desulfurococcales archaeon]|nr:aconitase X catalytic domain-containing protein [Desulfurococcales archaeon]